MLLQGAPDKDGNSSRQELSELEIEAVEMFINFRKLIGLPKSVGKIYGLLFVSPRALPMEEIITRLSISLGAASQGLKLLRNFGAVQTVYSAGDRRYHFAADLELSKFAIAFINDELRPRVDRAAEWIRRMEQLLDFRKERPFKDRNYCDTSCCSTYPAPPHLRTPLVPST